MDTDHTDIDLVARLKRLDASATTAVPAFDYQHMLERHAADGARARRRRTLARGTASALLVALVGASVWRIEMGDPGVQRPEGEVPVAADREAPEPRIVRADTYLALAALEDHIASVDDALSVARAYAPRGAEVTRLERRRAELIDSYAQVRYAELVSVNY